MLRFKSMCKKKVRFQRQGAFSSSVFFSKHTNRRDSMPSLAKVSDYETLRVGGLIFAGVVVFLSFVLLAGNKIRRCGKPKPKPILEDDD
ncbi:hypothetical protein OJAV_G00129830 [Oryzias javanicus]|uniref:FXYD domain-containing ion transport regulator n=1 Tax=Oryzias javanicus TaxID=123683 RepID=A0A3S2PYU0_ORYJA|nr:hypothetical protein OJAV_G00129830 [Oryzias javanicus]